jgi:hypothetical protein
MNTTLNKIRENQPCTGGWEKLLRTLGKTKADNEPLSLITILDSNGLDDALWCLQAVDGYEKEMRLYAVWCARQVQYLMKDKHSLNALDVAERFANGYATLVELDAAWAARDATAWNAANAAANAAAWSAESAESAAWGAAMGADAAGYAAIAAARAAASAAAWAARDATAWNAANAAANAVAWSAESAESAAWGAAMGAAAAMDAANAARDAARAAQEVKFREMFGEQKQLIVKEESKHEYNT